MKTTLFPYAGSIRYALWICLLLLATVAFSGALEQHGSNPDERPERYQVPQESIRYLEDPHGLLSAEEIATLPDSLFSALPPGNAPNFGFNPAHIWLRFTLPAYTLPYQEKVLEIKNPLLNRAELWQWRNGRLVQICSTGDELPFDTRIEPHKFFLFPVVGDELQDRSYLLHISAGGEQLLAPLAVWTRKGLITRDQMDHIIRGSYFGIIFFVLLFNLFIYAIIRERSSLYYVMYNLFLLLLQLSLGGYAFQYLWPSSPYLANIADPLFASLSVFALIRFSQHFLDLPNVFPRVNRWLQFTGWIVLGNALLSLWWSREPFIISVLVVNVLALLLNAAIIPIAVAVWRRKFRPAKFFLIGFLVLVLTVFGFIATNAGMIQSDFFADYGLLIGSASEVVLLSLAIVDRFKKFKDDALNTLEEMNQMQREQNLILERKVEERTAEILEQKEEILSSIRYAERIQKNVLPTEHDVRDIFQNAFVLYIPKDIVSGDLYWVDQRKVETQGYTETIKVFAIGDCTGHGVPGAMVSVLGCNLLSETIRLYANSGAETILRKTNEALIRAMSTASDGLSQDGMDLGLFLLNESTGKLQFAGANVNLYILRQDTWIRVNGTRRALGLTDQKALKPFSSEEVQLEKGDRVYIWTDGLCDQFGGLQNKKLKSSGVLELIRELPSATMTEQKERIQQFISTWKGSQEQTDDICVAGFRF